MFLHYGQKDVLSSKSIFSPNHFVYSWLVDKYQVEIVPNGFIVYSLTGFYLGFFVCAASRKNYFRPSRGVRRHAPPENFENIVFRIG